MNTTTPPIGLLLRRLDGLIDRRFEETLGRRSVTRRQWQLLNTLARKPAPAAELTAAVAPFLAAGETVEPHLEPLLGTGVVGRDGDIYHLTPAGHALFGELAAEVRRTRERTVAGLADGEYERAVASLTAMIRNLE